MEPKKRRRLREVQEYPGEDIEIEQNLEIGNQVMQSARDFLVRETTRRGVDPSAFWEVFQWLDPEGYFGEYVRSEPLQRQYGWIHEPWRAIQALIFEDKLSQDTVFNLGEIFPEYFPLREEEEESPIPDEFYERKY